MYLNFYYLTILLVLTSTVDYRFFDTSSGIPSVSLTELVSYGLLLLYVLRFVFHCHGTDKPFVEYYRKNRAVIYYFGWAALASIVGLIVRSSTDGLQMFKNLLPSCIVYFFILKYVYNRDRITIVLSCYLFGIFLNLILCSSQVLLNGPRPMRIEDAVVTKMDFSGQTVSRLATGFFNHPNGLAMLLLPAVILVSAVIVYRLFNATVSIYLMPIMLVLTLLALKYTYSKGVYAWSIIGCVLLLIPRRFDRWRFCIGVTTLLVGISSITFYSLNTVLSGGAKSLSTIVTRIYLWLAALEVIRSDNFVQTFGDGFKAMIVASSNIANWEYPNAHNGILNQILFYGIPAFCFYLWVFFVTIWRLSKLQLRVRADRPLRGLISFLFASLIALFGEYFFEPANVGVTLQAHFFLLIALATSLNSSINGSASSMKDNRLTA